MIYPVAHTSAYYEEYLDMINGKCNECYRYSKCYAATEFEVTVIRRCVGPFQNEDDRATKLLGIIRPALIWFSGGSWA
jgi:hypothetical protein